MPPMTVRHRGQALDYSLHKQGNAVKLNVTGVLKRRCVCGEWVQRMEKRGLFGVSRTHGMNSRNDGLRSDTRGCEEMEC